MLPISIFRDSPQLIFDDLKKRNISSKLAQKVIDADLKWRALIDEGNHLRAQRNQLSQQVGQAYKAGDRKAAEAGKAAMARIKERLPELENETRVALERRDAARMNVPNLLHESVPLGDGEEDNLELRQVGTKPEFAFEPRSHNELSELVGGVDLERGAKVAGARFFYLTGDLARLDFALQMYAIDQLNQAGYSLVIPPYVMNRGAYEGVVSLEDFQDVMYKVDNQDLYLIATAEHPLIARFKDEIIEPSSLPLKCCGLSTNFRKEAGAHGMSDRGLWRVRQFNKVEQVVICEPERSWDLHEELLANAEALFTGLGIPYRVVNVCTGDIGAIAAKKYDMEAWMPHTEEYKEVVSASNCTSYQAVRLNLRYRGKGEEGNPHPHTLNSTAIATSRALCAILENFQEQDGGVVIPEVLRPWMGGVERLELALN